MSSETSGGDDHFAILDLLRGVGAFCVVSVHAFALLGLPWFQHAYLTLDFFYVLSGFVVGYAYEKRLAATMSVRRFMTVRLIRFYPLILFGLVLGVFQQLVRGHLIPFLQWHASDLFTAIAANLVMLPVLWHLPAPFTLKMWIFPINIAFWSLFFEFFSNLIYAVSMRHWGFRGLGIACGLAALGLCASFIWGVPLNGPMDLGSTKVNFIWGFPRVFYSFILGLILYRMRAGGLWPSFSAGPFTLSALLLAIVVVPKGYIHPLAELLIIGIVWPFLVIAGSNHKAKPWEARIGKLLGDLSYPIYVVEFPIILLITTHMGGFIPPLAQVALALVIIGGVSWVAFKYWDEPVRKWLSDRLRARMRARAAVAIEAGRNP